MVNNIKFVGLFGVPCFRSENDYIEGMKDFKYFTDNNFLSKYNEFIAAMQITAMCAKAYIIQNWKKIDDWSDLEVCILDNTGKQTYYYKYEPDNGIYNNKIVEEVFTKIDKERKENENPVKTVESIILDHTDSDFSIIINGKKHIWIDDKSVILIAEYIETKLKEKEDL